MQPLLIKGPAGVISDSLYLFMFITNIPRRSHPCTGLGLLVLSDETPSEDPLIFGFRCAFENR
jgi:hypothetical protein